MVQQDKKFIGLYSIDYYSAIEKGIGKCGFSITLRQDVAEAIIQEKRTDEAPLLINMKDSFEQIMNYEMNYSFRFYKDTWLFTGLQINGMQCSCFGINNFDKITSNLRYEPHNIDSVRQANCFLTVWLQWFNSVIVLTEYRNPWRI